LREDEIYTALYQGRIDIGLVHEANASRSAKTVALFEDELIAVMAKDHPLAGRMSLMPTDFMPYEFFTYTLEHIAGWEHDRFFTPFGLVPVRRTEIGIIEAVIEMVRSGAGVTILSRDVVTPHLTTGDLTWVPLSNGLHFTWSAMIRSDEPASGLVAQMVKQMSRWTRPATAGASVAGVQASAVKSTRRPKQARKKQAAE
jgi:LysR family transcriptional regulator for metE and metH